MQTDLHSNRKQISGWGVYGKGYKRGIRRLFGDNQYVHDLDCTEDSRFYAFLHIYQVVSICANFLNICYGQ